MTTPHVDPSTEQSLSIWFFVGALMLACGAVIFCEGIYEFSHPPATVLANLHLAFWWGLLMTLFGSFYTLRFRPSKG
jgi:hypothetical protein